MCHNIVTEYSDFLQYYAHEIYFRFPSKYWIFWVSLKFKLLKYIVVTQTPTDII